MFIISWIFDKLGYMPKVSIDTQWPFPATQQDYVAPEFERPVVTKKKPAAKKPKVVAKSVRKKKA